MSQRYSSMQRMAYRRAPRRGMTLVEMLVAMALSLIIILAVTQVFRLVGDNVLASRAVTEMAGQLRATSDQLRTDLGNLTVPVRPWTDATTGLGYFELYEGPFWDLGLGPAAASAPPNPPVDPLNPRPIPWFRETSVGDFDDVLMFTARTDGEPFLGQVLGTIVPGPGNTLVLTYNPTVRTVISSKIAEIAWFTRWDDWNGDAQPDPGEVTLHRRIFLILPNLDLSAPNIQSLTPGQFFHGFDLSIRYQKTAPNTFTKLPNSLQTLSLRQNRVGHYVGGAFPVSGAGAIIEQPFPYRLTRALLAPQGTAMTPGVDGSWGVDNVDDDGSGATDDVSEAGTFGSDDLARPIESVYSGQPWAITLGESYGSDVMLSSLLAFDVKVFDPGVTIQQVAAVPPQAVLPPTPEAVLPGDPAYRLAGTTVGQGGYVDLFYSRYVPGGFPLAPPVPPSVASVFAGPPLARSGLQQPEVVWTFPLPIAAAVYDPWPLFYEHDGVDQDGNGITDQGTNGVDDPPFVNGVDDVGERETSPPYPVPLRSIQVRLRIIDPDSRQVRQVTVTSDFVPE